MTIDWHLISYPAAILGIIAGAHALRYLTGPPRIHLERVPAGAPRPLDGVPGWILGASINANVCPDCGCEDFFSGDKPYVGAIVVYCASKDCRSGFLVTNFGPEKVYAERASPGDETLY